MCLNYNEHEHFFSFVEIITSCFVPVYHGRLSFAMKGIEKYK